MSHRTFWLWMLPSGDPRRSVSSVASGKRMPGEVSMTVSPVPPSLDMTITCTSRVVPMSTQPPAVTSIPAISTATIASREIDVRTGSSEVDPVPQLGPASSSVGESVSAVALSHSHRCPVPQLKFWWGRVCQPLSSLLSRCLSIQFQSRWGNVCHPSLRPHPVGRPLLLLRR